MESTATYLKKGAPTAVILLFLGAQWWDLSADINELRAEMTGGFQEIRADMNADFRELRSEMVKSDQAIRAEMAAGDQAIRADISALGERLARVETRLTSVERAVYADLDSPPQ